MGRIQRFLDRIYKLAYLTEPGNDNESQMTTADGNLLILGPSFEITNMY